MHQQRKELGNKRYEDRMVKRTKSELPLQYSESQV